MKEYYMRFILTIFIFSLSMVSANAQTTWLVENNNDAGNGSLRAAVSSAAAGDIIQIDSRSPGFLGKGISTITLTSDAIVFATDNLVFKGFYNAAGDTVKVVGGITSGMFMTTAATLVTLDSMYLINGYINGYGGAVDNSVGAVTISNSIITSSTATYAGGGVFAETNATIINSTISGNTAGNFGAIGAGGGVCAYNGTASITNSTISGNTSAYGGGGVSAFNGGGAAIITNSTISGNTVSLGVGGGVQVNNGSITVNNSTISGNNAIGGGGLIASTINLSGSIVALNSGGDLYNAGTANNMINTDGGYSIFSDVPAGTVSTDQTGATTIQLNLGSLANNGGSTLTMLPGIGSIAINAGNPGDETADQRGRPWVAGTVRSVGAVNVAAAILPIKLLSFTGKSINRNTALLTWVTATEINNKGFALLRSADNGNTFTQIAFVNSLAAGGNSNGTLSYTYTDYNPAYGTDLYKLQ